MAEIRLKHLTKDYAGQIALQDVSFQARSGKLTVIVGPSGAGKSTLLRILAGLDQPTAGEMLLDNLPLTKLPPAKRDLAMVFQTPALYPYLTVAGNLRSGMKGLRLSRPIAQQRVAAYAERLGVQALLQRKPHELSGGEAHRVALGRALVRQPKVVLLDEPLSSLDAPLRVRLRRELKQWQRELHLTMLYVTHDQAEALALADWLVVLCQGQLLQQGPPQEVYRNPSCPTVASFLGNPGMNLLCGEIRDSTFYASGEQLRVSAAGHPAGPGQLGVRPECLRLATEGQAGAIAAQVQSVEFLGSDYLATVTCGGHPLIIRCAADQPGLEVGQTVRVVIAPDAIRWFPSKTVADSKQGREPLATTAGKV